MTAPGPAYSAPIRVSITWSPGPRKTEAMALELPAGTTVQQALAAAGQAAQDLHAVSIWSHKVRRDHVLQDGDRIELCRSLQVDPKLARRRRFARQGARAAGLFARRRPGAKPGY